MSSCACECCEKGCETCCYCGRVFDSPAPHHSHEEDAAMSCPHGYIARAVCAMCTPRCGACGAPLRKQLGALKDQLAERDKELERLKECADGTRVSKYMGEAIELEKQLASTQAKLEAAVKGLNFIVNNARSYGLDAEPYVERALQALAAIRGEEPPR